MDDVTVDFPPNSHYLMVTAVTPSLRQLRDDIYQDMYENIPVDTGVLQRSLYATLDDSLGEIEGGATAPYAAHVELGHTTSKGTEVKGRPVIRDAFLRKRGGY